MTVHAVHGTVNVDTSGTRTLNLPGEVTFPVGTGSSPVPWLCRVSPSDPAYAGAFKLESVSTLTGPADHHLEWLGARSLTLTYTLTGGSPLDVDFYLVWDDEIDLTNDLEYNGDT